MASNKSKKDSIELAKELGVLYDEICAVSGRMRECNSEFIQKTHRIFEEDEKYQDFKIAVLSVCFTKIEDGGNLLKYLKELDHATNEFGEKAHAVVDKYGKYKDPWKKIKEKLGEQKYFEILEAFYFDHFLTAQRFVLGAWRAKRKGDPLYMYKGPEPPLTTPGVE